MDMCFIYIIKGYFLLNLQFLAKVFVTNLTYKLISFKCGSIIRNRIKHFNKLIKASNILSIIFRNSFQQNTIKKPKCTFESIFSSPFIFE